jgi:nucleoside triphosphatase
MVLCRSNGKEKFFLPGGHIEGGELVEEALMRELKEELGITECENIMFAGVCDGVFPRDREHEIFQHEVC